MADNICEVLCNDTFDAIKKRDVEKRQEIINARKEYEKECNKYIEQAKKASAYKNLKQFADKGNIGADIVDIKLKYIEPAKSFNCNILQNVVNKLNEMKYNGLKYTYNPKNAPMCHSLQDEYDTLYGCSITAWWNKTN
jgi:hypothetical protein